VNTIHAVLGTFGLIISTVFAWIYVRKNMPTPTPPPQPPPPQPPPEVHDDSEPLLWTTQKQAWHSVRVICDRLGLSYEDKNLICACIYQESRFFNTAINRNKNKKGEVTSTDWGICQINDYFQVGPGKPFTSADDIVQNPEKAVKFMIAMFNVNELKLWVSYSSGAYKTWLLPASPMWQLAKSDK